MSIPGSRFPMPLILLGALLGAGFVLILWSYGTKPNRILEDPFVKETRERIVSSGTDQELQKFSLSGFDEKGKRFWKLEGDAAKIDQGQTVYLKNNVTLRLRDDTLVRTDRLEWAQSGGMLRTDAPVLVDHHSTKIKGMGAYGLPNQSFIQINKTIEMIISASGGNSTTTITCDGPMKIYYRDNKAVFYRNVKVIDGRGVLTAKRMDVYFDSQDKKVTQIIALGDVVIERATDRTRSQRAIYTPSTGSLRLEGNPEVTLSKNYSDGLINAPFGN